jgi:hypothetical protein
MPSFPPLPHPAGATRPAAPMRYLVMRSGDEWFILYNGEVFGPYRTDREAQLFATDAARKLGERGQDTVVLRLDETGIERTVWEPVQE